VVIILGCAVTIGAWGITLNLYYALWDLYFRGSLQGKSSRCSHVFPAVSAYSGVSIQKIKEIKVLHCQTGQVTNDPVSQRKRWALRSGDLDVCVLCFVYFYVALMMGL